jgi:hypothetical protein
MLTIKVVSKKMSEPEVWTSEPEPQKVELYVGDQKVGDYETLNAEDVKNVAKERGIKKFIVQDEWENNLSPSDFPLDPSKTKKVIIKEYNEAK